MYINTMVFSFLLNSFMFNWIIFSISLIFGIKFYIKKSRVRHDITNEIVVSGKTVIITGASDGMGKAAAEEFASRGANVVMACRNLEKAQRAVEDIRKSTGSGELMVMHLNLSSLKSVRKFVSEFISSPFSTNGVSILINNAGIVNSSGVLKRTEDGFEEQIGINHLGHFLLTNLLLPELDRAAKVTKSASRVIIVSAGSHIYGDLNFQDLNYKKTPLNDFKYLFVSKLHFDSKLANNLFNFQLAKQLRTKGLNVNSYALCPGNVKTNTLTEIYAENPPHLIMRFIIELAAFFIQKNVKEGTETILHCALSKYLEHHSGEMYRNCQFWDQSQRLKLKNEEAALLWEKSVELVNL